MICDAGGPPTVTDANLCLGRLMPEYVHCVHVCTSVLPRPFQHSAPPCLQWPYFFDVVTKMIDVVTNHATS